MLLNRLFQGWMKLGGIKSRARPRRGALRICPTVGMESLEDRRLLTVTPIHLPPSANGVLQINAGPTSTRYVFEQLTSDGPGTIRVTSQSATGQSIYVYADVLQIKYFGHSGRDVVENRSNVPLEAHGNRGDDSLIGGTNGDQLFGDDGNDVLSGLGGNDVLDGGNGNDTLLGGRGDDRLDGGGGQNVLDFGARPRLTISDVTVEEGTNGAPFMTGPHVATFAVTLAAEDNDFPPVTVNFATADSSATAGSDYVATQGTLTFSGTSDRTALIRVTVTPDSNVESNENFFVNLTNLQNGDLLDGQGQGTILNDDRPLPVPQLTISDVVVTEADSGSFAAVFTVSMSAPSTTSVQVSFATANGTAVASQDYTSANGSLTFNPGETQKQVRIQIRGDRDQESNETYVVRLSNARGATIADAEGLGTIIDNDRQGSGGGDGGGGNSSLTALPFGYFDLSPNGNLWGYTVDPTTPGVSTLVEVVVDGQPVNTINSDIRRDDVNSSYSATGNHGFSYFLPSRFFDGNAHRIDVYALDTTNTDLRSLISGSGATFRQVGRPEIVVDGVTDGQTIPLNFGTFAVGAVPPTQSFTVHNAGTATLTLGPISLPAGFVVTDGLPPSLAPGQSDVLTVQLNTSIAGSFGGTITIATNDVIRHPFDFVVAGLVRGPEIAVDGLTDGQTIPLNFGTHGLGTAPPTQSFTVRNVGQGILTLGPISLPAGFVVTDGLPPSLAPGQSDVLTVQLNTSAAGSFGGTITIATNDVIRHPFDFVVAGLVRGPEIVVDGVTDGQTIPLNFGALSVGAVPATQSFTVRNVGEGILTIGPISLPAGFELENGLPSSLAPGQSAVLTVRLSTVRAGSFGGTITIATNDVIRHPFDFVVAGIVRE